MLNKACIYKHSDCTGSVDDRNILLVHYSCYYMEVNRMRNIPGDVFVSDRLPYSKSPNCVLSSLVLVYPEVFDMLFCEYYRASYCTFALMYSFSFVLWALAVRTAKKRRRKKILFAGKDLSSAQSVLQA